MIIIPAIDIINGKCVRLAGGDYNKQVIYNEDPLEVAKEFESHGLQRLHLVDLDGARAGHIVNLSVLEKIAGHTNLLIDFSGGIKTRADVENVLNAGASIITIGSVAVKHPELLEEWIIESGPKKFLIGADVLGNNIKINGWLNDGGITINDFIEKMLAIGVKDIFCTDISKDGLMQGPSIGLYRKILLEYPGISLIASGGISSLQDIKQLKEAGCCGAIIGKAIYEGLISLTELQQL